MEITLEVLFRFILPLAACGFLTISMILAILLIKDRLDEKRKVTQREARMLRRSQPSQRPLLP